MLALKTESLKGPTNYMVVADDYGIYLPLRGIGEWKWSPALPRPMEIMEEGQDLTGFELSRILEIAQIASDKMVQLSNIDISEDYNKNYHLVLKAMEKNDLQHIEVSQYDLLGMSENDLLSMPLITSDSTSPAYGEVDIVNVQQVMLQYLSERSAFSSEPLSYIQGWGSTLPEMANLTWIDVYLGMQDIFGDKQSYKQKRLEASKLLPHLAAKTPHDD